MATGVLAAEAPVFEPVEATSHRERVFDLLAEAYAAAGQVAWKLGYGGLSTLCTERVEWAAQESADPLAMAAGDFYRAGGLICCGSSGVAPWRS